MRPIHLLPARPQHWPLIQEFHAAQNERDGTSYPLPPFFYRDGANTEQVPVSLVGIREGEKGPMQAIWVERRAELMFAGCDPKATAFARREIDNLIMVLRWLKYSGLHCDVPAALAAAIAKPLEKAGFRPTNEQLAHFYRQVNP